MKTSLKMLASAMVLTLGMGVASAQLKEYKIESAHSEADFAIKHLAISTVHGSFHGVTGVVKFDPVNVSKSSVEATIDVNTVTTGEPKRDGHLKTADFFDAAKYPTMTFKSTSVRQASGVNAGYEVVGDLTMHGVTKSVVLHLETPGKEQVGMDGKSIHRGFTATTTINRKDFGLTWNGTVKSGDAVLSDDVKIELDIDAAQS